MNGSVSLRDELLTKEELREKFGVLNYVVFFAMLVVSVLIGVFYWYRGNKTTEDFLLASRSMSTGQYISIITHPRTNCWIVLDFIEIRIRFLNCLIFLFYLPTFFFGFSGPSF